MSKKLTTITPAYHSFVKDQVLTDGQLNEIIEYFEDQSRLSRICLSGVGVACGFQVSYPEKDRIVISNGAGVTTDGDLINLLIPDEEGKYTLQDAVPFTHFERFHDEHAKYTPQFWKDGHQLDIWELFPKSQSSGKTELESFSKVNDLEEMVVVLFLESYTNEPGACTTVSCDNQGAEEVRKLRVLLIHKKDMEYLNESDDLFNSTPLLADYLELREAQVERVVLNDENTENLGILREDYFNTVHATTIYEDLAKGFDFMLSFRNLTNQNSAIQDQLERLFNSIPPKSQIFQYRYDLLKDVVDTYNELKEVFLEEHSHCCPDIHSFPKHLLLGYVNGNKLSEAQNPYRHGFYNSPIHDANAGDKGKFLLLVERCRIMMETYIGDDTVFRDIRITPSNLRVDLGKRAIPFYYGDHHNLPRKWDFDRSKLNKYRSVQGYQLQNISPNPAVKDPFKYSIDPYDFFRIEGHQGLPYRDALKKINELKEKHSLPFDVKVLGISPDSTHSIKLEDYACSFEDLSMLLTAWASEQKCILSEVAYLLSAFSTVSEGHNIRKDYVLQLQEIRTHREKQAYSATKELLTKEKTEAPSSRTLEISESKTEATSGEKYTKAEAVKTSGVMTQITDAPDTVGKVMLEAVKLSPSNNSKDIMLYFTDLIKDYDFSPWSDKIYSGTIDLPSRILATCISIEELLPTEIEQLSSSTLTDYTREIDALCSFTKRIQAKYKAYVYDEYAIAEQGKETKISKNVLGMMDLLNSQLTNICCGAKKIQTILSEIESRKAEILNRIKFSVFAKEHPGLEHKAGVEPGGTFVLVYTLGRFYDERRIPTGTVIADFSLPYLCCSDCAPINFIVPKTPVSLSLPTDVYCIDGTDEPLTFNVSPADGIIEAKESIEGLTITGKTLNIDSTKFPADKIGETIKFTVNSQYTDCTLVVHKQPSVDILVKKDDENPLTLHFEPTGDVTAIKEFIWDFGDGTPTVKERYPSHTYQLPQPNGKKSVVVKLTVIPKSGACPSTAEYTHLFDEITVDIKKLEFCVTDEPYPLSITPKGANPIVEGIGITEDNKFFDPKLTEEYNQKEFPLSYNGDVFDTVIVHKEAHARFTIKDEGGFMSLYAGFQNGSKYTWKFYSSEKKLLHQQTTETPSLAVKYATFGEVTSIIVVLEVESFCGTKSHSIPFKIPTVGTFDIEDRLYCSSDKTPYPFIVDGYEPDPEITGPGVKEQNFIPAAAGVGEHTIFATHPSGTKEVKIVVESPHDLSISVNTANNEIALTPSIDLTTIDSYTWRILTNEGALVWESKDDPKPIIPADQFTEYSALVAELTIVDEPCGERKTSQLFKVPIQVVTGTVSIQQPAIFCPNDKTPYPFIIEGYTNQPTIEGPGVNSTGTHFIPAQAGSGAHTITVNNGESTVPITVRYAPEGDFTGVISGDMLKLTATGLSNVTSYHWQLTLENGEVIKIANKPVHEMPVSELKINIGKPNYITVTLILDTEECGSTNITKNIDINPDTQVEVVNPEIVNPTVSVTPTVGVTPKPTISGE